MRWSPALLLLLGLGLGLLPQVGHAAPDAAPPTPDAIDTAIERGVGWLLKERRAQGTWASGSRAFGHTALALFALQHAGVDETEERAVQRSFAWLDRHGPGLGRGPEPDAATYDTSLALLFLRDRGRVEDRERIRRLAGLLQSSQAENGQWSYAGKPACRHPKVGDNSNTQFAVLALGAAHGAGVAVDPAVLERALKWWSISPQPDGGFGYASGGSRASASTGSMTAAAISSISLLAAGRARAAPALAMRVRDGAIQRLALGFRVDRNFGPPQGGAKQRQRNAGRGWNHYYLWSVERAMVLAGQERIGAHDWYAAGARHLLATQKKDGSWRGEHPLYATCFALLFLTRAADPPRQFTPPERPTGPITPRGDEPPASAPAEETRIEGTVDDWLREETPPETLRQMCLARGPATLVTLVQALGARNPQVRQRANEALRLLLGDDRVGRADRHPLARGRLKLWARKNARFLRAEDGRFVDGP